MEVSVSDSRTCIPEHKHDSIFDTFYTTKERGAGLGLSIARTIIETCAGARSGQKTKREAVPYSVSPCR